MNAAHLGDPCPIHGCGKKLKKLSEPDGRSLVCKRGHYIVNLDHKQDGGVDRLAERKTTAKATE